MRVADLQDQLAVLNPHLHEGVPLTEAARRAGVPRLSRSVAANRSAWLRGMSSVYDGGSTMTTSCAVCSPATAARVGRVVSPAWILGIL